MSRMVLRCALRVVVFTLMLVLPVSGWLAGQENRQDAPVSAADQARYFDAHIAPLLARHCLECHDASIKEGGLDLSRKDASLAGGVSGKAIVPGKSADSLLWMYVESDAMPPENRPPLSDQDKRHLQAWIDAGAVWSGDRIEASALGRDQRATSHWLQRLTVTEYIETVRSALGVDIASEAHLLLPPDLRADGFNNTAYNLNLDLGHIEAYAKLAEIIVGRSDVMKLAAEHASLPSGRLDPNRHMRPVIVGVGKWLLRGPLNDREIEAFLAVSRAVVDEGGDFAEAARYVVQAMLQSPRFLFRIENEHGDAADESLSDYELASRLSYILWGGPPDKELMRAADAGELSDPRRLESQVNRMLGDPRTVDRSAQFIHQWLDLDRLSNLRPQPEFFPQWNDRLAADMREETLAFFRDVAWEQKRPLSDLMNAQLTYATPRLAEFYGLDSRLADANSKPAVVTRPPPAPRVPVSERVTQGLQVLYAFHERSGDTVRDISGAGDPISLKIQDTSAVRWSDEGLTVRSPTLIASQSPASRVTESIRSSGELTLETWITPANRTQSGPARIVTLSSNVTARHFTLGQSGDRFETRVRTTATSRNGEPSVTSAAGTAATRPVHVVYTRDRAGKATIYVDGHPKGDREIGGDLSNWDGQFQLGLANELSRDRPWQGTLHLIAVFNRALSSEEARRHHAAGPRHQTASDGSLPVAQRIEPAGDRVTNDLQALYLFRENSGDRVRDVSGTGEPLDLLVDHPVAVEWEDSGLNVRGSTLIATPRPPKRLIDAVQQSRAITLEAWVTPADIRQDGPARILTLSSGSSQRNFTLGQDGNKFEVRFRTTTRSTNGLPSLAGPSGSAHTGLTHVVYTRNANGTGILYVDGQEKAGGATDGNLSNWDSGFLLALGNETTGDRPWNGKYHLVAIYSRALTADEVQRHYAAGPRPEDTSSQLLRYDLASVPQRGGLLTQGSLLTVGGDEASMVARGLFVLHDVLYSAVGSAPPGVDTTPVPTEPGLSQRQVAEMRLADQSCMGCHARFEPLAFGLEKFDGLGAYHEQDRHGNQLREDGEILFPGESEPIPYKTAAELMDLLAGSDRVRMNLTRKVTQFALGRPLIESDAAVLDQIHAQAWNDGGTYARLIKAVVLSDLVRKRRTSLGP